MMEPDRVIEVGGEEVEVTVTEGRIESGKVIAEEVEVATSEGSATFEFDPGVTPDELQDAISANAVRELIKERAKIDVSDPEWDEPRIINPDTKLAMVLAGVCYHGPCTSKALETVPELNNPSSRFHELEDKGLIAKIGKEGQRNIVVPTEVGWKEAMCIWEDQIATERTFQSEEDTSIKEAAEDMGLGENEQ